MSNPHIEQHKVPTQKSAATLCPLVHIWDGLFVDAAKIISVSVNRVVSSVCVVWSREDRTECSHFRFENLEAANKASVEIFLRINRGRLLSYTMDGTTMPMSVGEFQERQARQRKDGVDMPLYGPKIGVDPGSPEDDKTVHAVVGVAADGKHYKIGEGYEYKAKPAISGPFTGTFGHVAFTGQQTNDFRAGIPPCSCPPKTMHKHEACAAAKYLLFRDGEFHQTGNGEFVDPSHIGHSEGVRRWHRNKMEHHAKEMAEKGLVEAVENSSKFGPLAPFDHLGFGLAGATLQPKPVKTQCLFENTFPLGHPLGFAVLVGVTANFGDLLFSDGSTMSIPSMFVKVETAAQDNREGVKFTLNNEKPGNIGDPYVDTPPLDRHGFFAAFRETNRQKIVMCFKRLADIHHRRGLTTSPTVVLGKIVSVDSVTRTPLLNKEKTEQIAEQIDINAVVEVETTYPPIGLGEQYIGESAPVQFPVGATVKLVNGSGQVMFVEEIIHDDQRRCRWTKPSGLVERAVFVVDCLEAADKP